MHKGYYPGMFNKPVREEDYPVPQPWGLRQSTRRTGPPVFQMPMCYGTVDAPIRDARADDGAVPSEAP